MKCSWMMHINWYLVTFALSWLCLTVPLWQDKWSKRWYCFPVCALGHFCISLKVTKCITTQVPKSICFTPFPYESVSVLGFFFMCNSGFDLFSYILSFWVFFQWLISIKILWAGSKYLFVAGYKVNIKWAIMLCSVSISWSWLKTS